MKSTQARRSLNRGLAAVAAAFVMITGPAVAQEPIKVGAFLSVTGGAAFLGDPEQKTLELYVSKVNAAGGVLGRKLQLVAYDSAGDAEKGAHLRQTPDRAGQGRRDCRWLDHRRDHGRSAPGGSGADSVRIPRRRGGHCRAGEKMGVQDAAYRPHGLREGFHRHAVAQADQNRADFRSRRLRQVDARRMPEGRGQAPHRGGRRRDLRRRRYRHDGAAHQDQDTAGVQAVLNPGFGQGPAIVTKNYRQIGITMAAVPVAGVASKEFIKLAGAAAEGVRLPAAALLVADSLPASDPQRSVVVNYKNEYESHFKSEVSTFGGHAYDGLMLAVEAIKKPAAPTRPRCAMRSRAYAATWARRAW